MKSVYICTVMFEGILIGDFLSWHRIFCFFWVEWYNVNPYTASLQLSYVVPEYILLIFVFFLTGKISSVLEIFLYVL